MSLILTHRFQRATSSPSLLSYEWLNSEWRGHERSGFCGTERSWLEET